MTGRKRSKAAQYRRMKRTRRELADQATRGAFATELKAAYEAGASIRDLAKEHSLAFATIRALLLEAGAFLRARGGPNHTRRDGEQQPSPPDARQAPGR